MNPLTLEWVEKAVRFRYPGDIATQIEAKEAVRVARKVRKFVRGLLGVS